MEQDMSTEDATLTYTAASITKASTPEHTASTQAKKIKRLKAQIKAGTLPILDTNKTHTQFTNSCNKIAQKMTTLFMLKSKPSKNH